MLLQQWDLQVAGCKTNSINMANNSETTKNREIERQYKNYKTNIYTTSKRQRIAFANKHAKTGQQETLKRQTTT